MLNTEPQKPGNWLILFTSSHGLEYGKVFWQGTRTPNASPGRTAFKQKRNPASNKRGKRGERVRRRYSTETGRICTGREPTEVAYHVTHVVCNNVSVLSGSSGSDDGNATVLDICPQNAVLFCNFLVEDAPREADRRISRNRPTKKPPIPTAKTDAFTSGPRTSTRGVTRLC
jgi:hypothetical protein